MKLILIPDNPVCPFGVANRPKIAISIPGDGYTIHDILDKLVTPALVAMSFHPQTIFDGYRTAEVMGARTEGEEEASDEPTEWPAPIDGPTPPKGFTVVGYDVQLPDSHLGFPADDLRYFCHEWLQTPYATGHRAWYAARNGSETLAKLQAHVASL